MTTATTTAGPDQTTELASYTVKIDVGEFDSIPFEFVYRTDGTGTAKDVDFNEEVSFTWDPALLNELEGEIEDALKEHANEIFWDEINEHLGEDRVLSDADYGDGDLVYRSGSRDELEHAARLIVYSFPDLWDDSRDELDLMIRATSECEDAHLDPDYGVMEEPEVDDEIKNCLGALVELALRWNEPYGWSLEYNDGVSGRASGYYESAESIDFTFSRPSFHELAEARGALLKIFEEHGLRDDAAELLPEEE
jgi:hypothetical protein